MRRHSKDQGPNAVLTGGNKQYAIQRHVSIEISTGAAISGCRVWAMKGAGTMISTGPTIVFNDAYTKTKIVLVTGLIVQGI
jgi:hypothetical protein